jgi:hypothetical protein
MALLDWYIRLDSSTGLELGSGSAPGPGMDSFSSCVVFSRERHCTPTFSRTKPPCTPRRVFRRHVMPDASRSPSHHHKLGRADQSHVYISTCLRCDSVFVLSAPMGFAYFAEAEAEEPKSRYWPEGWRHHYQGISRAFVALLFCLL